MSPAMRDALERLWSVVRTIADDAELPQEVRSTAVAARASRDVRQFGAIVKLMPDGMRHRDDLVAAVMDAFNAGD